MEEQRMRIKDDGERLSGRGCDGLLILCKRSSHTLLAPNPVRRVLVIS
jgi:hypothetical protein